MIVCRCEEDREGIGARELLLRRKGLVRVKGKKGEWDRRYRGMGTRYACSMRVARVLTI